MARLKAAVIGCGAMGRNHLSALSAMDEIKLVAICDLAAELLEQRGREFGVDRCYTDMYKMLNKIKPDIVVLATQARQHREGVLACAAAKVKGVLCEKPMALDLVECDEMAEA